MNLLSRVVAIILLAFFTPLFVFISLISVISQGLPILFIQIRVGYNFREFNIYKFRTMNLNNHKTLDSQNIKLITKWGYILRKTKLDELPQLINILKGDMHFIGPRPEIPQYFTKNKFHFLKKLKPGLSDYASILLRNEEKILLTIGGDNPYMTILPFKISLAEYYVKKKGFWQDLYLVFVTIIAIVLPKFASKKMVIPIILRDFPELKDDLAKVINYQ